MATEPQTERSAAEIKAYRECSQPITVVHKLDYVIQVIEETESSKTSVGH